MEKILKDKVAVITGGTRGFGLAVASAYAREGAAVVIASRSQESVDRALEKLRRSGAKTSGIVCDVSDREQVKRLAQHAIDVFGHFDIWVNNAGIAAPYGPALLIDPDEFIKVLKTDIFGVYYGSIYAMRHFLPRGYGKLINILGRGDHKPVPMQSAYASSKAWVRSFTLALAKEYEGQGIGIFAFNPGLMETDLMDHIEVVTGYEGRLRPLETIMRMWANPPEVPAQKAVWLASAATDGKTSLEVHQLNLARIIGGLIREGLRRVTGQVTPPRKLEIESVPAELITLNSEVEIPA